MKERMKQSCKLFDLLKKASDPLLFDKDAMKFYNDQKSVTRKMALSKEVDIDYEQEIKQQRKIEQKIKEKDQMGRNTINDSDDKVTVLES